MEEADLIGPRVRNADDVAAGSADIARAAPGYRQAERAVDRSVNRTRGSLPACQMAQPALLAEC